MSTQEFEQVDINSFLDHSAEDENTNADNNGAFTERQNGLINKLLDYTKENDKEHYQTFVNRIMDLNSIDSSVSKFPSLLERSELAGGTRTRTTLIESLIKHQDAGDRTLRLPSKAVLGKSLLIAKAHTLSNFAKYAGHLGKDFEKLSKAFDTETILSMFSLLAEDVYLNLISDTEQPMEFRREWALSLLLLWEHWNDETSETVAPILQSVWTARRTLASAFGTMM